MSQTDPESARLSSCGKAFHTMMWGFLFFLPLPVPVFDALGWAILLAGLGRLPGAHPGLARLRALSGIGIAVWIVRVAALASPLPGLEKLHVGLYLATWAVMAIFARQLGSLIAELADELKADSVAAAARRQRWIPVLPFLAITAGAIIPPQPSFVAFALAMAVLVAVVWMLMGLMATAARTCALAERMRAAPPTQ